MDRSSLSDLGGALAIGSLGFAGVFLIVDGFIGLYFLIEQYSHTSTWAVLFSVPTLVLGYAFGVIAIELTDLVRTEFDLRQGRNPTSCFLAIARLNNEHVMTRYQELRRNQAFLQGSAPSLMLLGIGLFCATRWMGQYQIFGWVAGFGCLTLSVATPFLAHRLALQSFALGKFAVEEKT